MPTGPLNWTNPRIWTNETVVRFQNRMCVSTAETAVYFPQPKGPHVHKVITCSMWSMKWHCNYSSWFVRVIHDWNVIASRLCNVSQNVPVFYVRFWFHYHFKTSKSHFWAIFYIDFNKGLIDLTSIFRTTLLMFVISGKHRKPFFVVSFISYIWFEYRIWLMLEPFLFSN